MRMGCQRILIYFISHKFIAISKPSLFQNLPNINIDVATQFSDYGTHKENLMMFIKRKGVKQCWWWSLLWSVLTNSSAE